MCLMGPSIFPLSASPMGTRGRFRRMRWFVPVLAATTGGSACGGGGSGNGGGGNGQEGYVVALDIRGSAAAFAGRVIVVNGQSQDGGASSGSASRSLLSFGLCTTDRNKFLMAPLHIQVLEGSTLLTDSVVNRVACALNPNPGYLEYDTIILQDDGTILGKFGQDPGTDASCGPPGSPMICRQGETL